MYLKFKKVLLEMDGMLAGLLWITVLWSVSLPLMALEMWVVYVVSNVVIALSCSVHFYFINRHIGCKAD